MERSHTNKMLSKAVKWLMAQYDKDMGGFRFSPRTGTCLIGSCCAALVGEILNVLPRFRPYEVEVWADYIMKFQRDDGWFEDPFLVADEEGELNQDYLRGHATFLAVMALDALGFRPPRRLEFLEAFRDDTTMYYWIDSLDWRNPWRESNWVEWIGYWLLAEAELSVQDVPLQEESYPDGFEGLMRWLQDHQDPTTGFWGTPPYKGHQKTFHQMAAAYHHYLFFYATDSPIRYQDRIVDHTLSLQQPDGLFALRKRGGGPCEDLDAIDILANMHRLTDYRRGDIESALLKAVQALLMNQRADGAFVNCFDGGWRGLLRLAFEAIFPPWCLDGLQKRVGTLYRKTLDRIHGGERYYAGCPKVPFGVDGGDMFSMWFRPLAIAIAAKVLGPNRSPVWWDFGFRRQITQGWWPGANRFGTKRMRA
jgi:hypothetical protein